jgi:amino-acid N-acetyltransferase
MVNKNIIYRKSLLKDVSSIKSILDSYAEKRKLLSRSYQYILENIKDFHVATIDDKVVGMCSLKIASIDLAEIKSLAVIEELATQGIGKTLVLNAMDEGILLGIKKFFALTYVPNFFIKMGFKEIDKETLPHKIWTECVHCPFFPNCNEIAVSFSI